MNITLKISLLLMFLSMTLSCNTSVSTAESSDSEEPAERGVPRHGDCGYLKENSYSAIEYDIFIIEEDTGTSKVNQLKFMCTSSYDLAGSLMYGLFGPWSYNVKRTNDFRPIKIWEKVDLLGLGEAFTVFTYSYDDNDILYTSFMVFDEKNLDALQPDAKYRKDIELFFSKAILEGSYKPNDYFIIQRELALKGLLDNAVFDESIRSEKESLDSVRLDNVLSFLALSQNQPTAEMPFVAIQFYPGPNLSNTTGLRSNASYKKLSKKLERDLLKEKCGITGVYMRKDNLRPSRFDFDYHSDQDSTIYKTFYQGKFPGGSYTVLHKDGSYISYFGEYAYEQIVSDLKQLKKEL